MSIHKFQFTQTDKYKKNIAKTRFNRCICNEKEEIKNDRKHIEYTRGVGDLCLHL